jgi:hypothetical protein
MKKKQMKKEERESNNCVPMIISACLRLQRQLTSDLTAETA